MNKKCDICKNSFEPIQDETTCNWCLSLGNKKGGRGECRYCQEIYNNVSYHEAHECRWRLDLHSDIRKYEPTKPLREILKNYGLIIYCSGCKKPITEPGALIFSPPDKDNKSIKSHVCMECAQLIKDVTGIPILSAEQELIMCNECGKWYKKGKTHG